MKKIRSYLFTCLLLLPTSVVSIISNLNTALAQAVVQVAVIVNGNAITNYDINRRMAFLRLQGRDDGHLDKLARKELIEEMLRRIELNRHNITVNDAMVNGAFSEFAAHNHMTETQLAQMLDQERVTPEHFKSYIRVQIGWGHLVGSRFRAEGIISEEEAVQRMLQNGGLKPAVNEYRMQQIIFVIPLKHRSSLLDKRRHEANSFRRKIRGCESLRQQAKGMIDMTIRDLGRILEPQIPSEWEKSVLATPVGQATPIQETTQGVEFLMICSIRKVSDDRVAQLIFSIEDNRSSKVPKVSVIEEKYMKELYARAHIQNL